MAIYLFSVKIFSLFRCSSFDKKGGVGFFIIGVPLLHPNWQRSYVSSRYNFGKDWIESTSRSSSIFLCHPLPWNVCQSYGNALVSTSVSVSARTCVTKPLPSNGYIRQTIIAADIKPLRWATNRKLAIFSKADLKIFIKLSTYLMERIF
jgi:hypothetical protein